MDDALLSIGDAASIGFRIVDMADRVKVGSKIVPGMQAKWAFDMDGVRYDVVVQVAAPNNSVG